MTKRRESGYKGSRGLDPGGWRDQKQFWFDKPEFTFATSIFEKLRNL